MKSPLKNAKGLTRKIDITCVTFFTVESVYHFISFISTFISPFSSSPNIEQLPRLSNLHYIFVESSFTNYAIVGGGWVGMHYFCDKMLRKIGGRE